MTLPKTKVGIPSNESPTIPKPKAPQVTKPKPTFVPKMNTMRKAGRGR